MDNQTTAKNKKIKNGLQILRTVKQIVDRLRIFETRNKKTNMLKIIGLMLAGIVVGYLFRHKNLEWIQKLITPVIWLLLLLLGIAVGGNDNIINDLAKIGWQALMITIGAVGGSLLLAWIVYKFYFKK